MLQSTEIEIKLSELRTALRALQAGPPADDATEEVRAAHDTEVTDGLQDLDDLETQKRTALKAEEVAQERALKLVNVEQRVGAGDLPNCPPEFREFMGIEARCSIEGSSTASTTTSRLRRRRAGDAPGARGVRAWRHPVADARRAHAVAGDPDRSSAPRSPRARRCGRSSARSSRRRSARGTTSSCAPRSGLDRQS